MTEALDPKALVAAEAAYKAAWVGNRPGGRDGDNSLAIAIRAYLNAISIPAGSAEATELADRLAGLHMNSCTCPRLGPSTAGVADNRGATLMTTAKGVTPEMVEDADYLCDDGGMPLAEIGAGDAMAIIEDMPSTPQEAFAMGWNIARRKAFAALSVSSGGLEVKALTLGDLQRAHIERQEEWCPEQKPDLSFRGNEMAGEVGEACNVIKKLERERHGWRGSRATKEQLAEELADVIHTAVLCAITAGIDIEPATIAKFDATSEKNGLSTRLSAIDRTTLPAAEGMVLVPKEPTEAFVSACIDDAASGNLSGLGWEELYRNIYRVAVSTAARTALSKGAL